MGVKNTFCTSVEMTIWFFFFTLLIWWITKLIDFWELSKLWISKINPISSWCIILFTNFGLNLPKFCLKFLQLHSWRTFISSALWRSISAFFREFRGNKDFQVKHCMSCLFEVSFPKLFPVVSISLGYLYLEYAPLFLIHRVFLMLLKNWEILKVWVFELPVDLEMTKSARAKG